ncbi:histidine phosphatase family protein [Hasllibacter sp. MH4015]|uniref:histidine phosphatase family protein n=1 Tax=Hasllibacter sp. MH4015 TaxID=2854029 RepID=UPI001CD6A19A|nr:histidine phosphatase family protein [Hasllibacter sp. MH4015]
MVRRIFWVRHGPTHQKTFTGWRDVPADLSDTGAVMRMRDWLPADAPIASSDLKRAVATADAIAGGRRRLAHDPDLREFDFGTWDGLHFNVVAERDPDLSWSFWDEPGDVAAPGGESWFQVRDRVARAVDRALANNPGDVILVAHFGAILCHVAHATGQTPKAILAQKIDPLSVTELVEAGDCWTLGAVNHQP